MSLDVRIKGENGMFTIRPEGSIDSSTYQEFQAAVEPILIGTTTGIKIDLAKVDYISSAGLGVLFTIKKFLRHKNTDLYFYNVKPQIKRLFEIVKAISSDTLFANAEEADQYFYRMMNDEIERQKNLKKDNTQ